MWNLTSTLQELRDQATRALYWFGRGDPGALFDLNLRALTINDLYVPERLLAASYGVAMAHQMPESGFAEDLQAFLIGLRNLLIKPAASDPTSHWLARLYVRGTIILARTYYSDMIPEGFDVAGHTPFASGVPIDPIWSDDLRAAQVDKTLHIDFENYTLGVFFDDRGNYDMSHPGHQAAVAHVRGAVHDQGWREEKLGAIDKDIAWYGNRGTRAKTERYGKKYGWTGFYTHAGAYLHLGARASPHPPHEESLAD